MTKILRKPILALGTSIVCVALLSACTSIPRSNLPEWQFAQLDCAGLQSETAQAEETRRAAEEARGDAWKGVIPVGMLARYGYARDAGMEADRRLESLTAEQARKGCNMIG